MRFGNLKEFKQALSEVTLADLVNYLGNDLAGSLRELSHGLSSLSFEDNFGSFRVDSITLAAGQELPIRNQFRDGSIPSARIIVRGDANSMNVVDGTTVWTKSYVYLKNVGASSSTISVVFLK